MTGVCAACGTPTPRDTAECPRCGESNQRASAPSHAAPSALRTQFVLPDNIAGALAYLTVIPAIVFVLRKPYSEKSFVRFHAFQCIALAVASVALIILFWVLAGVPAINLLLIPVSFIVAIGITLLVLVCIIKAYQHQTYKLPVLGAWAEKLALRS